MSNKIRLWFHLVNKRCILGSSDVKMSIGEQSSSLQINSSISNFREQHRAMIDRGLFDSPYPLVKHLYEPHRRYC